MVLDNVTAFRFLKILDNLIFKQKSLFAKTAAVSKIQKVTKLTCSLFLLNFQKHLRNL